MQAVSRQHAGGDIFEAADVRTAREMCPFLGKMSLEDVELLLELEAIGKELTEDQPNTQQNKPAHEKIEEVVVESQKPDHAITSAPKKIGSAEQTVSESADQNEAPESAADDKTPGTPLPKEVMQAEITDDIEFATSESVPQEVIENAQVTHREPIGPIINTELFESAAETGPSLAIEAPSTVIDAPEGIAELAAPDKDKTPRTIEVPEVMTADSAGVFEAGIESIEPLEEAGFTIIENEEQSFESEAEPIAAQEDEMEIAAADTVEIDVAEESGLDTQAPDATAEAEPVATERHEVVPQVLAAIPGLPAPVTLIDNAMERLVEISERIDVRESVAAREILEEIVLVTTEFERALDEDFEVLGEKFEELFIELFDEADIAYTSELVDSFVKLTKTHRLGEMSDSSNFSEAETADLPDEIGTREFLQKLQSGLRAMKQSMIDFYELGKSILRLYSMA